MTKSIDEQKYIIRVDRPSMLYGVATCAEQYEALPNSEKYGTGSIAVFKMYDGRPYVVQFAGYKSGTVRVYAYEEQTNE